jgi:hypothetical protein
MVTHMYDDNDELIEESERRRQFIAAARRANAEAQAELQRDIDRRIFEGPEPTPWRHRVHAEPELMPSRREPLTDSERGELDVLCEHVRQLAADVERIEQDRAAVLEAVGEAVAELLEGIEREIDKRADEQAARWETSHKALRIEIAAVIARFDELRQLIASEGAKIIDCPNPLSRVN